MSEPRSSVTSKRASNRAGAGRPQAGPDVAATAGDAMAAGQAMAARHPYGPRALAALVPQLVRPSFARQPPATAQVVVDWEVIVGARLAEATSPRRMAAGTLTVACSGPMALELQHSADMLIARINAHMGHELVQRLRLVHERMSPVLRAAPAVPPASERDRAAVEARLADMPAGPVRDALAALGLAMTAAAK